MPPFVILSLPRSRSYWISRFLTYNGWHTGHDEVMHCRSLDDVRSWLSQPYTGTCETAAAPFWRLIPPDVRVVTVRRPLEAVMASWDATGMPFDPAVMQQILRRHDRKLDQLEARRPDVRRFEFDDMADEATCAALFEHCLPFPHDRDWWAAHARVNLQVSVPQVMRYYVAYQPQLLKLARTARHEVLRGFRRPVELDGVTFQQEPLHQAFYDGAQLMSDECMALGDYPEAWHGMNIPLFERLEAKGLLHIYTARSNGRMFGYVVTAIGEAFHARDQLEAEQVSFYADPKWPGLGRKLQHASCDDLRRRGVDRVMMFQPDETRVGLVYRRLGARQTGQRYVLELQ